MLLKDYTFETSLPEYDIFAETLNAPAKLSDIVDFLSYFPSVIKLCSYEAEVYLHNPDHADYYHDSGASRRHFWQDYTLAIATGGRWTS